MTQANRPSITERPAGGARFVVELVEPAEAGAWHYRGFVHLPDADFELEVHVDADAARATVEGGDPAIAATAAALVRAATKGPLAKGSPPPRKIARWRG